MSDKELTAKTETTPATTAATLFSGTTSPAMQIMLDETLFERVKQIATYISRAKGFTPPHLIGQPEACFAVATRALTWKLDPFAVAQSTYATPGGQVGYEGKLCQAILENSGKLIGPVTFEHYGDWTKVIGKFKKNTSQRGKEYPVPDWLPEAEEGLGVIVRAQVRGEEHEREWDFALVQAFPRNSTLWATDPKTQICYAAVRRFANVAAPGLFMGVPFDVDDIRHVGADSAIDVNPRPARKPRSKPAPKAVEAAPEAEAAPEPETLENGTAEPVQDGPANKPEDNGAEAAPPAEAETETPAFLILDEHGEEIDLTENANEAAVLVITRVGTINTSDAMVAFMEHNGDVINDIFAADQSAGNNAMTAIDAKLKELAYAALGEKAQAPQDEEPPAAEEAPPSDAGEQGNPADKYRVDLHKKAKGSLPDWPRYRKDVVALAKELGPDAVPHMAAANAEQYEVMAGKAKQWFDAMTRDLAKVTGDG